MTLLVEALRMLEIQGDVSPSGRWVKIQAQTCHVFVVEAVWSTRYYTWCDSPGERTVQVYPDPVVAIRAGLKRAKRE